MMGVWREKLSIGSRSPRMCALVSTVAPSLSPTTRVGVACRHLYDHCQQTSAIINQSINQSKCRFMYCLLSKVLRGVCCKYACSKGHVSRPALNYLTDIVDDDNRSSLYEHCQQTNTVMSVSQQFCTSAHCRPFSAISWK